MDGRLIESPTVPWRKLNRRVDVFILGLVACAANLTGEVFPWPTAASLMVVGGVLWFATGRGLPATRTGTRGLLDDVVLGGAMLVAATLPLWAIGLVVPRFATAEQATNGLLVMLSAGLVLRARGAGGQWTSTPAAPVVIVGTGPLGRLTGREMIRGEQPRAVLGYLAFGDETPPDRLQAPLLGRVSGLEAALRERVVGEVYFASTAGEHSPETQAAIRTCEQLGVPFALPVCAYRLTRTNMVGPASDGYIHFLSVPLKPLERAAKRAFDVVASGFALVALSPLLLLTAIAVKATSRGPVLFRQERSCLHGRKFHMLKFRSMVANAEELKAALAAENEQSGPIFKIKRDPRVTPVGRFIRKYSIDELPQLANVLLGDMSVVGPRPPLPSEVMKYEGWQYRRLSVRPGLTCVWQVSGRSEISFKEWMLLDMRYIDHWSLAGDFGLIWRTIPVVLLGRGAS